MASHFLVHVGFDRVEGTEHVGSSRMESGIRSPTTHIPLNLLLSMLAAKQAPVIMMFQRLDAAHDCDVNPKADLEIMSLHRKSDALREEQWNELLATRRDQSRMLEQLTENISILREDGGVVPESDEARTHSGQRAINGNKKQQRFRFDG